ncbi:MAG TPA: hypothetical protein VD886_23585 [Herpetosiphonaceae bacterium]|nr:hypothetical protein [Herpetosiphonaceae bacterium]
MAVQSRPFRSLVASQSRATATEPRRAGMLVVLAIVVALMCILYLAQTGRVATQGYRLEQLDAQAAQLTRENQRLLFDIEQAQSLDTVRQRAASRGFQPMQATQARYLTITLEKSQWTARAQ